MPATDSSSPTAKAAQFIWGRKPGRLDQNGERIRPGRSERGSMRLDTARRLEKLCRAPVRLTLRPPIWERRRLGGELHGFGETGRRDACAPKVPGAFLGM